VKRAINYRKNRAHLIRWELNVGLQMIGGKRHDSDICKKKTESCQAQIWNSRLQDCSTQNGKYIKVIAREAVPKSTDQSRARTGSKVTTPNLPNGPRAAPI
jgi:hypothetical protein